MRRITRAGEPRPGRPPYGFVSPGRAGCSKVRGRKSGLPERRTHMAGFRASQRARHRVERSPLAKPRTAGCGWRLLDAMAELGVGAPPAVPPPPLRQPIGRTSGRGRHGAIDREEATSESRKLYKSAADRTGPHLRRCSNESETRAMLVIFILPLATLYCGAVILMCVAQSMMQKSRWSITAQMVGMKLNIPQRPVTLAHCA